MRQSRGEIAACTLWAAALSFMTFGTFDSSRVHHNSPLLAWGIFLGMAALIPSAVVVAKWALNHDDGVTLERIVEVVDALHGDKRGVSRLR